jgi:pimeloyl-ACP methyl ester carboxylesterase
VPGGQSLADAVNVGGGGKVATVGVRDQLLRVCLERTVDLDGVCLRLRDWPGLGGPLVHVPDPLSANDGAIEMVAAALAWRYRVLSLYPRGASPYQVDYVDLLAVLDQFGFPSPVLIGERLGCIAALLVAAWQPGRIAGLVMIDPTCDPPLADGIEARALRDCPPDWPALRQAVTCPVLVQQANALALDELEQFLVTQLGPGVT